MNCALPFPPPTLMLAKFIEAWRKCHCISNFFQPHSFLIFKHILVSQFSSIFIHTWMMQKRKWNYFHDFEQFFLQFFFFIHKFIRWQNLFIHTSSQNNPFKTKTILLLVLDNHTSWNLRYFSILKFLLKTSNPVYCYQLTFFRLLWSWIRP